MRRPEGSVITLSSSGESEFAKTAFVFAGGGSFGATQVGMMESLARRGIGADMVVGASVGALNGAFYAGDPTVGGVERLANIWRGLNARTCSRSRSGRWSVFSGGATS